MNLEIGCDAYDKNIFTIFDREKEEVVAFTKNRINAELIVAAITQFQENEMPQWSIMDQSEVDDATDEAWPHEPIPKCITFNNHSGEKDICGVCGKDVGYFCKRNRWEHL